MFGGGVSPEEVGVDDIDIPSFILERLCEFVEEILSRDVIIQLPLSSYIEWEASYFAADFALVGSVSIIFGSSGGEIGDEIAIVEFVGHLAQVIA